MPHFITSAFGYFLSLLAARTAVVFLFIVLGLRSLGKRQLGQMNIYDLALIMALANAVQNAMTNGKGDLAVGIVCGGTLLIVGRLFVGLFLRLPRLEEAVCGTPSVIISDGNVMVEKMRKESISEDQLLSALHRHGLTGPQQAKLAILEVDGTLSIVPVSQDTQTTDPKASRPTDKE